jgi:Bacterial PH domain
VSDASGQGSRQTFRSPFAVAIWWLWALFAAGNLIDLAVQGRDHLSVVAAFILLLVTGVVYTTVQRPRVVADDTGMTIVNPLREHRIGWGAVAGIDSAELLHVRCEWPLSGGTDEESTGQRVIYAWAVQKHRRRQAAAQLRADRRRPRQRMPAGTTGPFGAPVPDDASDQPPAVGDAEHVMGALAALAKQGRAAAAGTRAAPPVSTWYWPAFAVIIIPALALVVAILA